MFFLADFDIFYVSNYPYLVWSFCNDLYLPMLFLDIFENVIWGLKFYDKQNYEKLEHI